MVAELISVETTVDEVLGLILGAQARTGKQQTLSWMQGPRGLDARGPGLTLGGIHFFLLFQVNSRALMLSKLLPKHEEASLTLHLLSRRPMASSPSVDVCIRSPSLGLLRAFMAPYL